MYTVTDKSTPHGTGTPHGMNTPHRYPTKTANKPEIEKATKTLFPTGRAWDMKKGGIFDRVVEVLNEYFVTASGYSRSHLDSMFPDNDNFTEEDLALWEYRFGLNEMGLKISVQSSIDPLYSRKKILKDRLSYYKKKFSNQSLDYINRMFVLYGYNAKCYENRRPPFVSTIDGLPYYRPDEIMQQMTTQTQHDINVQHGESTQHGLANYNVIANEAFSENYSYGGDSNLYATFFICSRTSMFAPASIPEVKIEDFRRLVLKLKPAHLVAFFFNNN